MGDNPIRAALSGAQPPLSIVLRARQLLGKPGLQDLSLEDLQQHLVAGVLAKANKFDPRRSQATTYIDRVAESVKLMLLRERRAIKRGGGAAPHSLDAQEEWSVGVPIAGEQVTRLKQALVRQAQASLPPGLMQISQLLASGKREAAIAHHLGLPRSRIRAAIQQIRQHFEERGVGPD